MDSEPIMNRNLEHGAELDRIRRRRQDLGRFALARMDAAIAAADELLELQRELCGPPDQLRLGTLRQALERLDAYIREISMISLSGIDFSAAPVTSAKILEQLLKLRRQIEARIHHREDRED